MKTLKAEHDEILVFEKIDMAAAEVDKLNNWLVCNDIDCQLYFLVQVSDDNYKFLLNKNYELSRYLTLVMNQSLDDLRKNHLSD